MRVFIISSAHILKNIGCIVNEEVLQEQMKKKQQKSVAENRLALNLLQQNSWVLHKYFAPRSSLSFCFLGPQAKYSSPYLKSQ